MQQYRVRLASPLIESMTLATVEAYNFRDPKANNGSGVETYGYVWGHRKSYPHGLTVFYLDKFSVSIAAKRSAQMVVPNRNAGILKRKVLNQLAPHRTLLADFHSHPYASQKSMKLDAGYEFSDVDFDDFLDQDLFWESSNNNPVMLVQTICPLGRRVGRSSGWQRRNVFYFDVDGYRLWVNAAVGYLDEKGKRRHTGNRTRFVAIEPLPFTAHFAFSKIDR